MNAQEPLNNTIIEVHAVVQGRVQGVGFRAAVRHHSLRFGLVGTVRNLTDGSVEMFLQGSEVQIDRFFEEISNKFTDSILSISKKKISPRNSYTDFQIIRTHYQ